MISNPIEKQLKTVYHGTSKLFAQKILSEGFRPTHYTTSSAALACYGDGVYFFDKIEQACDHARLAYGEQHSILLVLVNTEGASVTKITSLERCTYDLNYFRALSGDIIDAAVDRGIFVLRPNAMSRIASIDICK